jgi:hypothetical protein
MITTHNLQSQIAGHALTSVAKVAGYVTFWFAQRDFVHPRIDLRANEYSSIRVVRNNDTSIPPAATLRRPSEASGTVWQKQTARFEEESLNDFPLRRSWPPPPF